MKYYPTNYKKTPKTTTTDKQTVQQQNMQSGKQ